MVGSVDHASPVANHLGKRKLDQELTATQDDPGKQQRGQPLPSQQPQEPSSIRPHATQQPPPNNHNSRKRPADHIITDASSLLRPTNRPRWATGVIELGLSATSTTTPRSPYRFNNNSPQPPVSADVSRLPGWHFSKHRAAAAGGGPSSLSQGSGRPSLLFGRRSLSTDTTTTNGDGSRSSIEGGRAPSTQPSHQRRKIRGPLPASSRLGLSPTRIVGTSLLLPTTIRGGVQGREGGDGSGGGDTNNSSAELPEFESVDGTNTIGGGDEVVGFLPALTAITNNLIDQGKDKTEVNPIAAALAEAKKKEEVVKTEMEEKNKEKGKEGTAVTTTTAAPPAALPAFTFGGGAIGQEKKKEEGVTEKPPQAPTFTFGSQPQQQQAAAAPVFSFGEGVQPSSDTGPAVEQQQQPAPFSFSGSAALPSTVPNTNNNIVFQAGGTQSGSQATSGGRRVVRSRRPRR